MSVVCHHVVTNGISLVLVGFTSIENLEGDSTMTEENKTVETSQQDEVTETEFDPVQAINELKQNTVSKEEYNKVVAEKNKYLKALVKGTPVPEAEAKKEVVDIPALVHEMRDQELDNLTYWKKGLKYRDAVIDQYGIDPFAGRPGVKWSPTDIDYEGAQKLADKIQECINTCDNNSEIFTAKLQAITNDVAPQVKINPKIKR